MHWSFATIYFTRTVIKLHISSTIRSNTECSFLCTKQARVRFYQNFDNITFIVIFMVGLCAFLRTSPLYIMRRIVPQWLFGVWLLQIKEKLLQPSLKQLSTKRTQTKDPGGENFKVSWLEPHWEEGRFRDSWAPRMGFLWLPRAWCVDCKAPAGKLELSSRNSL